MKYFATLLPLSEPQRGKDLLVQWNTRCVSQERFVSLAPILTDGTALLYPVILLVWYIYAILRHDTEAKIGALYVFASAAVVGVVNFVIQLVVEKSRPEGYIDNAEMLIMDHLPTAPFPSDHAAVGAAVACAVLVWAYRKDIRVLKRVGGVLAVGSVVMSLSRVGVAIHRPTDVIVGTILGCLIAWVLYPVVTSDSWIRKLMLWAIGIEERVMGWFGLS